MQMQLYVVESCFILSRLMEIVMNKKGGKEIYSSSSTMYSHAILEDKSPKDFFLNFKLEFFN